MPELLDLTEVDVFFDRHFHRSAFRLECLDQYEVASDGTDYQRYLAGEPEPNRSLLQPWLEELRRDTAAGKRWSRVHVLRSPLHDYLRYECEWGYTYNVAAGEDVRILDLAETPRPRGLVDEEFWLLDDQAVLLMRYDAEGRFLGGEPAPDEQLPRYRAARDAGWTAATPFRAYWAAHPEYHRGNSGS